MAQFIKDTYAAGKKAVTAGINIAKEKLNWQSRYKILLIGETGSGKTSFLNLICNYNLVQTLGFQAGVKEFHAFHKMEFESDSSKMESKTNNATMYNIEIGSWPVGVRIDTPGFGDSRGMEEDKKHVGKIIEALEDETYINCVCLVINGRAARMSGSLKYVLSEVTSILPKTVVKNVIVVFTNTTSLLHLSFDIPELKKYFGCEITHNFCIENPYCLFEKAKENPRGLTMDMIAEGLKDEFEKTTRSLEKMFTQIKEFEQVHTNDFMVLYNKKQEVEKTVLITLVEYNNQMELEKKLAKETEKLIAAILSKSFHEGFESEVERFIVESTSHHNTICGAPGCYSNCHINCSLDKLFDKETFKNCVGIWCHTCGHSYRDHYHTEVIFKRVKEKRIDKDTKAKYDAAKFEEEKSRIAKTNLENQKVECEQEKKRLSEKLVEAIEEFQKLGVSRSYLILLENQLYLIEQYLKAEVDNKDYLEKTKKHLKNKIAVVKESVK